jgi:glutamate formiminotransferase / formiminotetrahydrofolate cyclodeaminase
MSQPDPNAARPIVEIVPNFSEGRRADVISSIVDALMVPGVTLLSRHADPDHNRLDCTLVGSPDAVRRSALAGAARAIELIDMRTHRGSHPRMGAVDVIPFVPVRGLSMEECIDLARSFAEELAEALSVPVYLYDRAATVPERASLADVRRGEYEALREDVARGSRLPDFGPHELGAAGAVAVGARAPLIAFNVYLSGSEEAAKEVARIVRESSGGLPAVRAIGFAVPERGLVQVSMNLVDYETTGMAAALGAVEAHAAARGMEVVESEIVGLVPQAALDDAVRASLRLGSAFDPDEQVLERLVSRANPDGPGEAAERTTTGSATGGESPAPAGLRMQTVESLLADVAGGQPTPGGGSSAAVAGALGAALVAMVGRLTTGKEGYEDAWERMGALVEAADRARERFLELADSDAAAFGSVMDAFKLPKGSEEERSTRSEAIAAASAAAADVPSQVCRLAVEMLDVAVEAIEGGNANAASDGAAGAQLLAAAARSAAYNVAINLGSLKDPHHAERLRSEGASLEARAAELLPRADAAFRARLEA